MEIDSAPCRKLEDGDPIALMARETRTVRGAVPAVLAGVAVPENSWRITRDAFLLRVAGGPAFPVRG